MYYVCSEGSSFKVAFNLFDINKPVKSDNINFLSSLLIIYTENIFYYPSDTFHS